jgi:tRNA dimethylallyltransferase
VTAAPTVQSGRAPRALVIAGPTSSGKSALALALAGHLPIEIVCCDSQQVYAGLDIGTGKPTREERARVAHHLLDVVTPRDTFHAARWARAARQAIDDIVARNKVPVVVAGTGLYLRALTSGLFEAPPPSAEIRERHRREAARLGTEALHARLGTVDPEVAARVMPRDLVRISRALEVFEQTGEPISVLRRRAAIAEADRVETSTLVLSPLMGELKPRIERRFDAMLAAGLLDETRALVERFGADARGLQALGYAQLARHLAGQLSLEEATVAAKSATVTYARRQRTWFRKHHPDAWRSAEPPPASAVRDWWRDGG